LRGELARRSVEANVYVGMRYWRPYSGEAIDQIVRDGVDDLILLPLYPQFSVSTTGSSFKDFEALIGKHNGLGRLRCHYIPQWHTHETYIRALAEQISGEVGKFPDPDPRRIHLLFSAHSVPQSYIERGDPYLQHIEETVRLVSEGLGDLSPVHLSFQSKVGPVKWLEPSTDAKLRELASKGVEQVLAIPVSFVSDHIETLYELDILYKHLADEIGIKTYRRVPALNCNPTFINSLADLVCENLE
jgi:ferrochelatase